MAPSRDILISLGSSLSPSMRVLGRLGERLQDPDAELTEIIDLVRLDPSLTFKIMRLANGVMFGSRGRCDSLEEAVARVGVGEIHRLVGLAAAHQAYQGDLAAYGLTATEIWENSVAVAAVAAVLAELTGGDARAAYTAGLLRNVGRVVLDRVTPAVHLSRQEFGADLAGWERATRGVTAAETSALLLDHWRFPEPLVGMVAHHLDPDRAPPAVATAARLLHLAGRLAVELGVGLRGEDSVWLAPEALVPALGLEPSALSGVLERARVGLEQTRQALGELRKAA